MSRVLMLIGVLLVVAGSYILVKGFSVTSNREVLNVGPLEASVEERRQVPPWMGGVGVAAGLVLVIASMGGRSRSRA
jgi:hypothetical protein